MTDAANDPLLAALERIEAQLRIANTRDHQRWLSVRDIAAILGNTAGYVARAVCTRPDFPEPLRIGGVGQARYRADEVHEWMERERRRDTRASGRPRPTTK